MRNLKVFAVVAATALAISGFAAASAFALAYHSESETTTWTGEQKVQNTFVTNVGTMKCTTATYVGETKATSSEMLTVHPTYSGCTLAGQKVSVNTASCNYTYTVPTGTIFSSHWIIHNECSGKSTIITDSALGCEIEVGSQIFGGVMKGENLGSGSSREEEGTQEITGVAYSYTASCPSAGGKAGSASNGTRGGSIRFKGKNGGGTQVGVWVE